MAASRQLAQGLLQICSKFAPKDFVQKTTVEISSHVRKQRYVILSKPSEKHNKTRSHESNQEGSLSVSRTQTMAIEILLFVSLATPPSTVLEPVRPQKHMLENTPSTRQQEQHAISPRPVHSATKCCLQYFSTEKRLKIE